MELSIISDMQENGTILFYLVSLAIYTPFITPKVASISSEFIEVLLKQSETTNIA